LDEDLQKITVRLLGAWKNAHFNQGLLRELVTGNDCFSAIMTISHWPTSMIGPGGES
jgi:hypothetical protein